MRSLYRLYYQLLQYIMSPSRTYYPLISLVNSDNSPTSTHPPAMFQCNFPLSMPVCLFSKTGGGVGLPPCFRCCFIGWGTFHARGDFLYKLCKIVCITRLYWNKRRYCVKVPNMREKHPAIVVPPDTKLGPAMKSLNTDQQGFVCAMIEMGGLNHTKAALVAGYGNGNMESAAVAGHRLAHDDNILAAIHEEAHRRLRSGAIMAVQTLLEIANNPQAENKDRLKAVEMMLNRSGLHAVTEHNVKVEHRDTTDEGVIKKIKLLAERQGLDPVKLLGSAGVTVDAEFKMVEDDLQDIF